MGKEPAENRNDLGHGTGSGRNGILRIAMLASVSGVVELKPCSCYTISRNVMKMAKNNAKAKAEAREKSVNIERGSAKTVDKEG